MSGFLAAVTQREFWTEAQIRQFVFDRDEKMKLAVYGEKLSERPVNQSPHPRAMLIFTVEKEQTWLVAGPSAAYCVLDERKWAEPQVKQRGKLDSFIPVRADELLHADRTWPERIGVLHFGNQTKGWLYSKELFLNERPEDTISRFLLITDN